MTVQLQPSVENYNQSGFRPVSLLLLACFIIVLCGLAHSASALQTKRVSADYIQARLLSGVTEFEDTDPFPAALEIRLDEGWHAYWRTPGEGGLPPELIWAESDNLNSVFMQWPAPQRFETFGLTSFGYEDRVIFPLRVTPETADSPVTLKLDANIMVCKDICVPQPLSLSLDIPPGQEEKSRQAAIIDKAVETIPVKGDVPVLDITNVVAGPDALIMTVKSHRLFDDFDVFVELDDGTALLSPPEITPDKEDPRTAQIKIVKPDSVDSLAPLLMGKTITVTVRAGDDAIEKDISL